MSKIILNKKYFFFGVFFTVYVLILNLYSAYVIAELSFLILCVIALIVDKKFILFFYIYMLSTNFLVSEINTLFGLFGAKEIISITALWVSTREYRKNKRILRLTDKKVFSKFAMTFLIFIVTFLISTLYRDIATNYKSDYNNLSIFNFFTYSLKLLLFYSPLYIIIKLATVNKFKDIIFTGILLNLTILAIGVIFADIFINLGVIQTEKYNPFNEFNRNMGFFGGGGDSNSLSGYLVILVGFIFYHLKYFNNRLIVYLVLTITILSLFYLGSRAGLLGLTVVLLLNLKSKNSIYIFILLIFLFFILPENLTGFITERFADIEKESDKLNEGSRVFIWTIYLNEIFNNTSILLYGAKSPLFSGDFQFVPHNFYLTILYRWGIFPLLFIISIIYKMTKHVFLRVKHFTTIYFIIIIPFLITSNSVSDIGVFLALILSLSLIDERFIKKNEVK